MKKPLSLIGIALLILASAIYWAAHANAQSATPWFITGTGNHYVQTVTNQLGLKVPGLATSTTGCLSVSSTGWISANGSACGSGAGSSFSTTSADYWKSVNNFFSTTSANFWASLGLGFSTTSENYYKSVNNFFSTTSADLWGATKGYVATGTTPTRGQLAYWGNTSVIATLMSVATSTMSPTAPLAGSFTYVGTGGTLSIPAATNVVDGYLTAANHLTYSSLAATGSAPVSSNLAYWGNNGTLFNVATSTLSASGPLTGSFTQVGSGGALGCTTAASGVAGCLSNTSFDTFNNKQVAISVSEPIILTGAALSFNRDWIVRSAGGYLAPTTTIGVIVSASSTIGAGALTSGLTVNGGATTTGIAYFGSNVGIGTTTPYALVGINAPGGSAPLLAIGSSTSEVMSVYSADHAILTMGTGTPWAQFSINPTNLNRGSPSFAIGSTTGTQFVVLNNGNTGVATATPGSLFAVGGALNITTGTSTFVGTGGVNITSGCFAIRGTCIAGTGGSGTVTSITLGAGLDGVTPITTSGTIVAQVSTGTVPTIGQLAFWGPVGTPSPLFSVATSSLSGGGPITVSNSPSIIGASTATLGCTSADNVTTGCLTSANHLTYSSLVATGTPFSVNQFAYTNNAGLLVTAASSSLSLPNTALQNSTISGVALGSNLAGHTTNASLTGTSYNGSAAVSDWGINLGNSNIFTVGQVIQGTSTIFNLTTLGATSTNATTTTEYVSGGLTALGSSTFAGNATTSGTFFATNASTTKFFGASLPSAGCTGANALQWNAGLFNCVATATFGYPFLTSNNSTTSPIMFLASTTIGNGSQDAGLTISGGATTTGFMIVQSTGTSTYTGAIKANSLEVAVNAIITGTIRAARFIVTGISSAFTPAIEGEIGIDNTDNQLKFFSSSAVRVIPSLYYSSFSYATSTPWTGTTTISLGIANTNETYVAVRCKTNAGTLNVAFNTAGSTYMNYLNASTTVGTTTMATNPTIFVNGIERLVDIGTPASSPTRIGCTVTKSYNPT